LGQPRPLSRLHNLDKGQNIDYCYSSNNPLSALGNYHKQNILLAMSPSKTKVKHNIVRRHVVDFKDNAAIPESRLQEMHCQYGRVSKFDVATVISPVLTSARMPKQSGKTLTVDHDELVKLLCNLDIDGEPSTPTKLSKTAAIPDETVGLAMECGKQCKDDEEFIPSEENTDTDSDSEFSSSQEDYITEDENDLDCGVNYSDDESDSSVGQEDPFSPERARGMFSYTVPDIQSGTVRNVRRSSRNSFCSPNHKKSTPKRDSTASPSNVKID
jgi:hypothetical protein